MKDDDILAAQVNIKYLERELAAARETLRDKFAMAALTGHISSGRLDTLWDVESDEYLDAMAKESYEMADKMMEARK